MSDLGADRQESGQPRARRWGSALAGPLVVGGLVALAVFVAARPANMPLDWVVALLPGVSSPVEVQGGARVELIVGSGSGDGGLAAEERATIDARLAGIGGRAVQSRGRQIVVELAGATPDEASEWIEGSFRPGRLEIVEVDESSPLMMEIGRRAEGDPDAQARGVSSSTDYWEHDDAAGVRNRYSDRYLEAASPSAIADYLAAIARATPSLGAPPGRRFVFEAVERDPEEDPDQSRWRSYLVIDRPVIGNGDIESASAAVNPITNRPFVRFEMDEDAGDRFADWTERLAGQKVAILLDGVVTSAPIVTERIDGRQASVMVPGGPRRAWIEARTLAAALVTPGLDRVSVSVASAAALAPTVTAAERIAPRALLALLCGLVVAAPAWLLGRRARPIAPGIAPRPDRLRRGSVWGRAAVTAAGVGLVIAGDFLLWLPSIDTFGSPELAMAAGDPAATRMNTFALGLFPFVGAFFLIELAALIVPRWRGLRVGGPAQRARLGSATAVLGVLLALLQSWFVADWLAGNGLIHGAGPFWITIMHLTAGAIVLALVALVIDRYGLGSGFATLLASGTMLAAFGVLVAPVAGDIDLAAWLRTALGVALTVVVTAGIVRWQSLPSSAARPFRLPTAGILPLLWAPSIVGLLALRPDLAGRAPAWFAGPRPGGHALELALVVALAAAFSWLFSRPSRLGQAELVDARASRSLWAGFARAAALSTAFVVALVLIERAIDARVRDLSLPVIAVAIVTALVMDLVAEWKARWRRGDLVAIWPLHRVQRVDLVMRALAVVGIDAHARGVHLRSLLHFFGPFVPVVVFVPAGHADEARKVVRAQLGVAPALSDDPDRSSPPAG